MLEIKHVPTSLILFAITKWEHCGKYAKQASYGNNTNPFIKAIAVWLILKNETTSGTIHHYRQQLPALARKCKMSVRTLEKNINWLRAEGLCFTTSATDDNVNAHLELHHYKILRKYGLSTNEREQTIQYDLSGKTKLYEQLIAIGIQRLMDKRCNAYWKKIYHNPDEHAVLCDLLVKYGAERTRLNDVQYFRTCHLELMLQCYEEAKPGQESFQLLHKDISANPDLNAKHATYGRITGYTVFEKKNKYNGKDESVCAGFSSLLQRLQVKGLITSSQDNVEAFNRARKDEKTYHHRWLNDVKRTIWFRCAQLVVNIPLIFKTQLHAKATA